MALESSERATSEAEIQWIDFCKQLQEAGSAIHRLAASGKTNDQQHEINFSLVSILGVATIMANNFDSDYPDWIPFCNSGIRCGAPNPDTVHYIARIRGSRSYLITGQRRSVKMVMLSLHEGFVGITEKTRQLGGYDLDDFNISDDGSFKILIGPEANPDICENWMETDPKLNDLYLFVRQVSYDWSSEEDAIMSIYALNASSRAIQRVNTKNVLDGTYRFVKGYANHLGLILQHAQSLESGFNSLKSHTVSLVSGATVKDQEYIGGTFRVNEDQAIVVTIKVPSDCRYWNIQLRDSFFNGLDFIFSQTSLNGFTAHVDPDGIVRIVVSQRNPGIANWLDKGDYEDIVIRLRWLQSATPEINTCVVNFADLSRYLYLDITETLPADGYTATERRIFGAQKRRRW